MIDYSTISKFPRRKGIYFFYDKFDNLLYIGKATDIRGRIRMHYDNWYNFKEYYKSLKRWKIDKIKNEEQYNKIKKLIKKNEIIYIQNLIRICEETQTIDMIFSNVKKIDFILLPKEKLHIKEKELITTRWPLINIQHNDSKNNSFKINKRIHDKFKEFSNLVIKDFISF